MCGSGRVTLGGYLLARRYTTPIHPARWRRHNLICVRGSALPVALSLAIPIFAAPRVPFHSSSLRVALLLFLSHFCTCTVLYCAICPPYCFQSIFPRFCKWCSNRTVRTAQHIQWQYEIELNVFLVSSALVSHVD